MPASREALLHVAAVALALHAITLAVPVSPTGDEPALLAPPVTLAQDAAEDAFGDPPPPPAPADAADAVPPPEEELRDVEDGEEPAGEEAAEEAGEESAAEPAAEGDVEGELEEDDEETESDDDGPVNAPLAGGVTTAGGCLFALAAAGVTGLCGCLVTPILGATCAPFASLFACAAPLVCAPVGTSSAAGAGMLFAGADFGDVLFPTLAAGGITFLSGLGGLAGILVLGVLNGVLNAALVGTIGGGGGPNPTTTGALIGANLVTALLPGAIMATCLGIGAAASGAAVWLLASGSDDEDAGETVERALPESPVAPRLASAALEPRMAY